MTRRATIEELARWLRARDSFAVIGHVSPDGDAAGSCVAVAMALRAMGKRAFACLPSGMPKMFSRFAGADGVIAAGAKPPFSPETALALDVSDEGRRGDARVRAHARRKHSHDNKGPAARDRAPVGHGAARKRGADSRQKQKYQQGYSAQNGSQYPFSGMRGLFVYVGSVSVFLSSHSIFSLNGCRRKICRIPALRPECSV